MQNIKKNSNFEISKNRKINFFQTCTESSNRYSKHFISRNAPTIFEKVVASVQKNQIITNFKISKNRKMKTFQTCRESSQRYSKHFLSRNAPIIYKKVIATTQKSHYFKFKKWKNENFSNCRNIVEIFYALPLSKCTNNFRKSSQLSKKMKTFQTCKESSQRYSVRKFSKKAAEEKSANYPRENYTPQENSEKNQENFRGKILPKKDAARHEQGKQMFVTLELGAS